jgi:2-polyprenyl-6-methoxyphenol hydroxylase-like FAD-dependent oxidoreductase
VRLGVTVSQLREEDDSVSVEFSDGRTASFDLLTGFDGIRSAIRLHLVGTAFAPRPSGYGAWRVQAPRPDFVRGMEFLQGVGSKTGAMPLSNELMYLFHIGPEVPDAACERKDHARLLKQRLAQYGGYVAEIRDALVPSSDVVYSPIEPMLLPWPWFRGRIVVGGDAAHVFAPHLTQGAAMAVEDAYVLANETLKENAPLECRLMNYSTKRYARCAFVYTFSRQWLDDEQSVRTAQDLEAARAEMALNASARIAASDRILNTCVI